MSKSLQDTLAKSNAKLLAEFKWGAQGEAEFHRFMSLVRKNYSKENNTK
ncbi:hypothetical protein [Bacillus sp. Marseille-P3800]|nr:hypothetical protein [Bacillus sp. Marseille-P3800]